MKRVPTEKAIVFNRQYKTVRTTPAPYGFAGELRKKENRLRAKPEMENIYSM